MGHNVGKAADNAVQAGQGKKKEVRTAEQAIRTLRELRAAHLHVSPSDVDLLLAEYDSTIVALEKEHEQRERWQQEFDKLVGIRDGLVADLDMVKTAKDFLLEENERLIAGTGAGKTIWDTPAGEKVLDQIVEEAAVELGYTAAKAVAKKASVIEMKKSLPMLQEILDTSAIVEALAVQGFEVDPDAVKKLESEIKEVEDSDGN